MDFKAYFEAQYLSTVFLFLSFFNSLTTLCGRNGEFLIYDLFMILMESISLLESGLHWLASYALGLPRVDSETPCSSCLFLRMIMVGIQPPFCEGAQPWGEVCVRVPPEPQLRSQPKSNIDHQLWGWGSHWDDQWSPILLITTAWEIINDKHLLCLVNLQNK